MGRRLIHKDFVGAYVYFLKVDGVVRYVGKGRRYRALEHFRNARDVNERRAKGEKIKAMRVTNSVAKAMRLGRKIEIQVLSSGMNDAEAYLLEMETIASFPKEQLCNIHKGGSGGDADMMRSFWSDPIQREKFRSGIARGHLDPAYRERARATTNGLWSDPEFRKSWMASHRSIWDDPKRAAERRALLKKVWSCPEKTARKSALVKSQWTPERKAAMSENRRKAWSDPEFKRRASESIRKSRLTMSKRPVRSKSKHSAPSQYSLFD
jgi:hypothetical protein